MVLFHQLPPQPCLSQLDSPKWADFDSFSVYFVSAKSRIVALISDFEGFCKVKGLVVTNFQRLFLSISLPTLKLFND